jgi:CHAT domain-containing protein
MDTLDVRLVSSTKNILRAPRPPSTHAAVLVGNPQFSMPESALRTAAQRVRGTAASTSHTRSLRSMAALPTSISALPETKEEVLLVRDLFERHARPVETLTEDRALEEAVKGLKAPRVLHLATHGFFLPDQELADSEDEPAAGSEDPMLRSGIVLAGAEYALAGRSAPELEDGILTAYEAVGLDLQGTELVTLSACETGLGDVKTGEGVFGLRRALEVAGADAVLMSLWAVPDRETKELMSAFYRRWLAGEGKHEALRGAQLEVRELVKERYGRDLPYYWGAFVLVGR